MANMTPYEYNIQPLIQPIDQTNTDLTSGYIDLRYTQELAFLVQVGVITTATATDSIVLTLECATGVDGAEATIGFSYREGGLVTANTWGAITAKTATGLEIVSTDDGKSFLVTVNPDDLAASDYRVIRMKLTTPDDMSNALVSACAFLKQRYSQVTHIAVTASASA